MSPDLVHVHAASGSTTDLLCLAPGHVTRMDFFFVGEMNRRSVLPVAPTCSRPHGLLCKLTWFTWTYYSCFPSDTLLLARLGYYRTARQTSGLRNASLSLTVQRPWLPLAASTSNPFGPKRFQHVCTEHPKTPSQIFDAAEPLVSRHKIASARPVR